MSKQVIVVWRHLSNFSAISWGEQVNFQWDDDDDDDDDDEARFVPDQHDYLDFYSVSSILRA